MEPATSGSAAAFSRSSIEINEWDEQAAAGVGGRAASARRRSSAASSRERTSELEATVAELKERKRIANDAAERERDRHRAERWRRPWRRRGRAAARRSPRPSTRSCPRRSRRSARPPAASSAPRSSSPATTSTWDMVPYDVQLIGGIQLHLGRIAEMATGEGKTLVATLPLYLNALPGQRRAPRDGELVPRPPRLAVDGARLQVPRPHGRLHRRHGARHARAPRRVPVATSRTARTTSSASTTCATTWSCRSSSACSAPHCLRDRRRSRLGADRRSADAADHLGSGRQRERRDVLRAQRGRSRGSCARQTELVNTLVAEGERAAREGRHRRGRAQAVQGAARQPEEQAPDEAAAGAGQQAARAEDGARAPRRPQAAASASSSSATSRRSCSSCSTRRGTRCTSPIAASSSCRRRDHDAFVLPGHLERDVHRIDHDHELSPRGEDRRRGARSRSSTRSKSEKLHIVHQLLRAHALYEKDVNYVVQDGEVLIVDEFTGRTMPGRRWSDGLHQAVEAKEGVQREGRDADARHDHDPELLPHVREARRHDRHGGDGGDASSTRSTSSTVAVIPTNKPMIRDDRHDLVYKTRREKYNAIVEETRRLHELGLSRCSSARRASTCRRRCRACSSAAGLAHNVLNAKYHQREAEIVAGAGQPGAITIATNMAGRGTDIKLGAGVTESKPSSGEGSRRQGRRRARRSAGCTSSAPSATSRGASTGSCAAAPAARAIRARRSSSCRSRTT